MRRLILFCLLLTLTACASNEPSSLSSQAALSTPTVEQRSQKVVTEEPSVLLATETGSSASLETPLPTETALPSATETPLPTDTALPSATETPLPTDTALPSATETPLPTETALPSATETPLPTDTALPSATETPLPTETALPSATETPLPTETALPSATALPTNTLLPTETALPFPTETPPPPPTEPPAATFTAQPVGITCQRPPDDLRRVDIWVPQLSRQHIISERTLAMLENAQALYGGIGSMQLLIQGSYAPGLGASFGTHDAGGAVDIWTVDPNNTAVLLNDIDSMVWALRQSGFAAWFRPKDMLYVGMYPHIHAIAIGDRDLSGAAAAQLTGEEGYFRARNGLPEAEFMGWDPHNGPTLCPWMEEMGYQLLPYPSQGGANNNTSESSQPESTQAEASSTAQACQQPIDEYGRIPLNGYTINQRTYSMLQTAQGLYHGAGDLLRITQGSYTIGLAASFGTHDGGGAVDISIRHPQTGEFLYNEAGAMVQALRQAGFAAWYRSPNEGFAPHIHAIAIGDKELSSAAIAQLTGEQGYFRGRNGLLDERAAPDPHGGPWICDWMIAAGYRRL